MNNDNPILNNTYEEPRLYYNVDINGNLDYGTMLDRRPYVGQIFSFSHNVMYDLRFIHWHISD